MVTGWPTKNALTMHFPSLSCMPNSGKCNTCIYASCSGSAVALNSQSACSARPSFVLKGFVFCSQGLCLLQQQLRSCKWVHWTLLSARKHLLLCNSCSGLHKCGACVSVQQCNDVVEAMPESGESTCPSDTRWADLVSEEPACLLLSHRVH